MNRYPLDKFPSTILRPEVVSSHEELMRILSRDIDRYGKIGRRDTSMFDWTLRVLENLGLSTVETQYLGSLAVVKTTFALWEVLIDDLIDNADMRNPKLVEELLKIPFDADHIDRSKLDPKELEYLDITKAIWNESLIGRIKKYPHYEKYCKSFEFDVLLLMVALRYSKFVNESENAVSIVENEAYMPHSMQILIQMDLDLMCSKGFRDSEFGMLRELNYISQRMAKIGNLLGTYPRELLESDMSSEALVKFQKEYGEDFRFKINKLLNRESRYLEFEEGLLKEYKSNYHLAEEIAKQITSIDVERFLQERNFIQKAYQMKADFW